MIHCIQIRKHVTNRNKQLTEKMCQMEWLPSMVEMDVNTGQHNSSPMLHSFSPMTAMPWTPLWKREDLGFRELCPKGQGFSGCHFFPDTHFVSQSFLFAVATPTYRMFRLICAQPLPYYLGIRILCLESPRAFHPRFLPRFRFMANSRF
ncbi:hypothetical protein T01_2136 [Trichinella spiralis]|uniref:Uncharacterized protein n=1 Tax=Trichinella spiralis TaxID=6334 RepID=A0A0V1AM48_TRISP|nr:hypothetical protein T01_2136 [Trichinella spiralis]